MEGRVRGWKGLKEALRDQGLEKEQMEQMQWFEKVRRFDLTGRRDGREISWAKGMVDRRLG